MADSMMIEVIKSVVKTTLTSTMIAISVVRIAMLVYPSMPDVVQSTASYSSHQTANPPANTSQLTPQGTKRRIVLGRNSIENLGRAK